MVRHRPRPGTPPRRERGITLAEILVVIALSGIVLVPLGIALRNAAGSERAIADRIDVERIVDRVGDQIEVDLRRGRLEPSRLGGRQAATNLVLSITESGSIRDVEWSVAGTELRRRVTDRSTGTVVADVIVATVVAPPATTPFVYVGIDGSTIDVQSSTDAACVARIDTTVVIAGDESAAGTATAELARQVAPRIGGEGEPC